MENMKKFESGAIREDKTGKGRMDLLPMCALMRVARHMENALKNHPERNWEKGIPMHSFLDSALRHLFRYMDGQDDEDHLCSAAWNILCAMWTEEKRPEMMDIPTRKGYSQKDVCNAYDTVNQTCMETHNFDSSGCDGNLEKCNYPHGPSPASSWPFDIGIVQEHPERNRSQGEAKETARRANAEQG